MTLRDIKRQKKFNFKLIIYRAFLACTIAASIIISVVRYIRNPGHYEIPDQVIFAILATSATMLFFSLLRFGRVDNITQLPTTDVFSMKIFKVMFKKQLHQYAVLFMNIKNFKHINRIVGSVGGDQVLYKYSKKIRSFLLPREYMARLGGDNFIILVYKHRLDELLDLLKNMKVDVDGEASVKDLNVYTRAGIYTLSDRDSVNEVFNNSSVALSYARNSSFEDFVWFQKFMLEQTYEEKEIAYVFMKAVQNKDFEVYYQPRIKIDTNQVCGAEALVRWNREGKVLLPETFLISLEKSGLISTLDFYVMEQVCRDINIWKQKGLSVIPISENFSKPNIRDNNFVHRIMATISEYKIETSQFQVEIAESFSEDLDYLAHVFEQLHNSGISTLLDDFGSGGFSWKLLKDSNLDAVKLDKSIIENIEVNGGANENEILARNIIHACCDLKKMVICEGVENAAQRDLLLNMRCNEVQGFLYDEPLPINEFEKVLEKKSYKSV